MPDTAGFEVLVRPVGRRFFAGADIPLLASAEQSGMAIPVSCRNGTCRTCMCRLVNGKVAYRIEWPGLSADEKRDGFILPCIAYPLSDLVVDIPGASASGLERCTHP